MSHYTYLDHTHHDYEANRKGHITRHQLEQMQYKLLMVHQRQRNMVLILGIGVCILMLLHWAEIAFPFLLFLVFASVVYPRQTRRNLRKLGHVELHRMDGFVRLMNQDVRNPEDPLFVQLKHIDIDFNFDVPAASYMQFDEDTRYRFYYTESPCFVLSAHVLETVDLYNERKAHETL